MILKIGQISFLMTLFLCNECMCESNITLGISSKDLKIDVLAEKLSKTIFDIGQINFSKKFVISVALPAENENSNIVHILSNSLQKLSTYWTVVTNDSFCSFSFEKWVMPYFKKIEILYIPDVYIIPLCKNMSVVNLNLQLAKMDRDDTFNPTAIFLLVQLKSKGEELKDNEITAILNKLWSKNLLLSTLIIISEYDLDISIVTAEAFSSKNMCRNVEKGGIKHVKVPLDAKEIDFILHQDETKDLLGCVFWVGTIPIPPYVIGKPIMVDNSLHYEYFAGIDIEFLRLFSTKMNFTYKFYKTHGYDLGALFTKLPNGSVIGILQDTLMHDIDIAFGGITPSYVSYYKYDYSASYRLSSISWFVTDANILPQWMIFFIAFPFDVWILSGFTYIIVCLLYYVMDWYSLTKPKLLSDCNFKKIPFANLFSLGLGLFSTLNPSSSYLRALIFSWAVYSMHWYIAYTSILFTLLTNPPLEKEIITIQDLKDSGLKVSVDAIYLEIFGYVEIDKTTRAVLDNHFECNNLEYCVKQLVQNRNISILEKDENIGKLVNMQRSKIHKLSDPMMAYSISFLTSKGNILSKPLNKLLVLALQSGLLEKWENDATWYYHNLKTIEVQSEENSLPLSIQDLKGAFFILIIGLIISLVVFIVEIFVC